MADNDGVLKCGEVIPLPRRSARRPVFTGNVCSAHGKSSSHTKEHVVACRNAQPAQQVLPSIAPLTAS